MKILAFKNYLALIKNNIGSTAYRDVFAQINGQELNITLSGQASCAYFVSNVLKAFDLCTYQHTTVVGVEKDLLAFGWEEVPEPVLGSVIFWERKSQPTEDNGVFVFGFHCGFYVGNKKAISNDPVTKVPIEHHYTYDDTRRIIKILWHPKLSSDWII